MEKFITATGKTIDLAIAAALEELHMDRDNVSVEVLENPRSGFLGIGAQPARVKVTYEAPDEAPKPALSSASRSKPKKPAESKPADGAKVIAPAAPKVIAPAAPEAPRPQDTRAAAPKALQQPRQDRAPKQRGPRPERRDQKPRQPQQAEKPAVPAEPKVYAPAEPGSREERIEIFIKGLLEHMGSDAVPHAVNTGDDTYLVDLVGENLGILIGRRGETLDAIQHLTNYAVNRGQNKRVRINVDAESYRLKREQAPPPASPSTSRPPSPTAGSSASAPKWVSRRRNSTPAARWDCPSSRPTSISSRATDKSANLKPRYDKKPRKNGRKNNNP